MPELKLQYCKVFSGLIDEWDELRSLKLILEESAFKEPGSYKTNDFFPVRWKTCNNYIVSLN